MRPSVPPPSDAVPVESSRKPLHVDGVPLGTVDGLAKLPVEVQAELVAEAERIALSFEEEMSSSGAVLLLAGELAVSASVSDVAAARVVAPSLVICWSTVRESASLKLTALQDARLVSWPRTRVSELLSARDDLRVELDRRGDRLTALTGATVGPLGDLDDSSRDAIFERLELRWLEPGETWAKAGADPGGLAVVGAGALVVQAPDAEETLGAGELVCPSLVLESTPHPADVVAGPAGALVLAATKSSTLELFSTLPVLLELLRVV